MDIRKTESVRIDPILVSQILKKVDAIPWLKHLVEEYVELLNICENSDELDLINYLIDKFLVLNMHELSSSLQDIKDYLTVTYDIKPSNTMFYAFSDNKKPDGSQFVIQAFKNKFHSYDGWGEENFSNTLLAINDHNKKHTNILLIDDFIGTGNTTTTQYSYAKRKLTEKSIKINVLEIVAVAGMEFSKQKMDANGISYYCSHWLKKGISETLPSLEIDNKKGIMINIESRLDKRKGRKFFPFGFEESESLFAIEEVNIPDNVFPVFWWPYTMDGVRRTMFKGLR